MKIENDIGWCDATGNTGIGCRGCELGDECYAKFDTPARLLRAGVFPGYEGQKIETFGKNRTFVPTKKGLSELRRLNKLCICDKCHTTTNWHPQAIGERCRNYYAQGQNDVRRCYGVMRRIRFFPDSNSDWMDWPTEQLAQGLDVIRQAPNVDVILLTKWPELWRERITAAMKSKTGVFDRRLYFWLDEWLRGTPPKHVVVKTSVLGNAKDQPRIEALLKIPAHRRGLSCEPLWDKVVLPWKPDYSENTRTIATIPGIDWVIVGCDSSKKRKGWQHYNENALSVIQQCQAAGVRVWHKQMPVNGGVCNDPAQFPANMRQREFPSL